MAAAQSGSTHHLMSLQPPPVSLQDAVAIRVARQQPNRGHKHGKVGERVYVCRYSNVSRVKLSHTNTFTGEKSFFFQKRLVQGYSLISAHVNVVMMCE